ncbi:MAG TPA: TlpA disulfide reductase family protein [bacterium]|nr:TlpA disulfide reductase family protein [bacterium]
MCNADAPGWERVYEAWKTSGVKLVGIGLLDSKQACQAFARRHGLTFPNAYDPGGKAARSYGFTDQPFWAVIDRHGDLLKTGFGPRDERELVSTIKALAAR